MPRGTRSILAEAEAHKSPEEEARKEILQKVERNIKSLLEVLKEYNRRIEANKWS